MNSVAGEKAAHFQLMADLFLYANDKSKIRTAGQSYVIALPKAKAATTLKVARLEYGGNFDPEPAGWPRLSNYLAKTENAQLEIVQVKLGDGKLDKSFAVAHLTGRAYSR